MVASSRPAVPEHLKEVWRNIKGACSVLSGRAENGEPSGFLTYALYLMGIDPQEVKLSPSAELMLSLDALSGAYLLDVVFNEKGEGFRELMHDLSEYRRRALEPGDDVWIFSLEMVQNAPEEGEFAVGRSLNPAFFGEGETEDGRPCVRMVLLSDFTSFDYESENDLEASEEAEIFESILDMQGIDATTEESDDGWVE